MRGEYIAYAKAYASKPELPPRARRIPEDILAGVVESGTTSACAENTQYQGTGRARCRNYLRVRGEYRLVLVTRRICRELPPRARRIPPWYSKMPRPLRTTSACAENTPEDWGKIKATGNYLRVRGEYHETLDSIKGRLELPPRARRIREVGLGIIGQPGTTSACAENTRANSKNEGGERNYLRVRGEYVKFCLSQL